MSAKRTRRTAWPRVDVGSYRGQWIALNRRTYKIVGHGATLQEAERGAQRAGVAKPLLFPVPKSDAYFVGLG